MTIRHPQGRAREIRLDFGCEQTSSPRAGFNHMPIWFSLTGSTGGQDSVHFFSSCPVWTSDHLLNPVWKPRSSTGTASDIHASHTFQCFQLHCEVSYFHGTFLLFLYLLWDINIIYLPGFLLDWTNEFPLRWTLGVFRGCLKDFPL